MNPIEKLPKGSCLSAEDEITRNKIDEMIDRINELTITRSGFDMNLVQKKIHGNLVRDFAIALLKTDEVHNSVSVPTKRRYRKSPEKFNPRDVAILGGDPSL